MIRWRDNKTKRFKELGRVLKVAQDCITGIDAIPTNDDEAVSVCKITTLNFPNHPDGSNRNSN
ncbi:MAG: hypothetical protein DID90_2727552646 [Candidatus Nitrotoga sp. LAW]|nr:MAG: hypothetical protein DID90_2727552646 [Candidatus Nitrotoga sp. LAW]